MTHLGKMESKGCSACTGVLSLDNARSPTLGTRTVKECVSWTSQSALRCSCSGSVAKLCPTLGPRGLQHARLLCPSRSPGICSNSCPLSWWCHTTISSSAAPFSFGPQSFPASGSFPMSRLNASSGHTIGASASNNFQWLLVTWSLPIPTLMLPESVQEYCLKQATFYCKYLFVLSQWLSFYLGIVWN